MTEAYTKNCSRGRTGRLLRSAEPLFGHQRKLIYTIREVPFPVLVSNREPSKVSGILIGRGWSVDSDITPVGQGMDLQTQESHKQVLVHDRHRTCKGWDMQS